MNSLFKVNGKPYFSIGGQVNNSTGYDSALFERALKAASSFHMNTVAAPVYWETLEREEGVFDFSQVDMLIEKTKETALHLVILWFGTWKNGNSHYVPEWVKKEHSRFLWACGADLTPVRTLSPHCHETCEADKKAFVQLCKHIEEKNSDETVIGIQVENEPGIMGTPRDCSDYATQLFYSTVPDEVADFAGKSGTWEELYGFDAAEFFTAYAIAKYIDEIAAAGKEMTNLPMYVNVWLGEMHNRIAGIDYPSGGAVSKVIDLFRKFAPQLDTISPDIYLQGRDVWDQLNAVYSDGTHPYYVPELLSTPLNSTRAIQAVVENGLSGVHYFGIDSMLDADGEVGEEFKESADTMCILNAMKAAIEKFQGDSCLYAVAQYEGESEQYFDFGDYIGSVRFDNHYGDIMAKKTDRIRDNRHPSNPPLTSDKPKQRGKGIICYLGNGEFYLAGSAYRLMLYSKKDIIQAASTAHSSDFMNQRCQPFLSVEEGHFDEDCNFIPELRRNGDEADYGFWVTPDIGVLRVRLDPDF